MSTHQRNMFFCWSNLLFSSRIRWVRFGAAADSTAGPSPDVAAAASWVALAWDWPIGSEKPWVFHGKMICTWLFYGVFHAFSMYNWFAVWNIWMSFPYIGNNNPNWLMFFRGVETINQIMYLYYMMLNLIEQSRFFYWDFARKERQLLYMS